LVKKRVACRRYRASRRAPGDPTDSDLFDLRHIAHARFAVSC